MDDMDLDTTPMPGKFDLDATTEKFLALEMEKDGDKNVVMSESGGMSARNVPVLATDATYRVNRRNPFGPFRGIPSIDDVPLCKGDAEAGNKENMLPRQNVLTPECHENALTAWLNEILKADLIDEEVTESAEEHIKKSKDEANRQLRDMLSRAASAPFKQPNRPKTKEVFSAKLYGSCNDRLNKLRSKAAKMYTSSAVPRDIERAVKEGKIAIRTDKLVYADIGIQMDLMQLLRSFHPIWLRLGLETVFEEVIFDAGAGHFHTNIVYFICHRLFRNPQLLRKYVHPIVKTIPLDSDKAVRSLNGHFLAKICQFIYFVDTAKKRRLILQDPCVFLRNSTYKTTEDVISFLSRELISGSSNLPKTLSRCGFQPQYQQTFLDEYHFVVKDITRDLTDGIILAKVVELITNHRVSVMEHLREPRGDRIRKVNNVKTVLKLAASIDVNIGDMAADKIVRRHKEETIGLIWRLIGVYETEKKRFGSADRSDEAGEGEQEEEEHLASTGQQQTQNQQVLFDNARRGQEISIDSSGNEKEPVFFPPEKNAVHETDAGINERTFNCRYTDGADYPSSGGRKQEISQQELLLLLSTGQNGHNSGAEGAIFSCNNSGDTVRQTAEEETAIIDDCRQIFVTPNYNTVRGRNGNRVEEAVFVPPNSPSIELRGAIAGYRNGSAVVIQKYLRRFLAMRKLTELKSERDNIQLARDRAAVIIQSHFRRFLAIKTRNRLQLAKKEQMRKEELERRRCSAIILIQSLCRRYLVQRKVTEYKAWEKRRLDSVIIIQSAARRFLAIRLVTRLKENRQREERRTAAVTIQCWYRQHLAKNLLDQLKSHKVANEKKRSEAIVLLQSNFRRLIANKLAKEEKVKKEVEQRRCNALLLIQRCCRLYLARCELAKLRAEKAALEQKRLEAAVKIQCHFRRTIAVRKLYELKCRAAIEDMEKWERERQRAALIIQSCWRRQIAGRKYGQLKAEMEEKGRLAAISIQRCYRLHLARRQLAKLRAKKAALEQKRLEACVKIQSAWRGHATRRDMHKERGHVANKMSQWRDKLSPEDRQEKAIPIMQRVHNWMPLLDHRVLTVRKRAALVLMKAASWSDACAEYVVSEGGISRILICLDDFNRGPGCLVVADVLLSLLVHLTACPGHTVTVAIEEKKELILERLFHYYLAYWKTPEMSVMAAKVLLNVAKRVDVAECNWNKTSWYLEKAKIGCEKLPKDDERVFYLSKLRRHLSFGN